MNPPSYLLVFPWCFFGKLLPPRLWVLSSSCYGYRALSWVKTPDRGYDQVSFLLCHRGSLCVMIWRDTIPPSDVLMIPQSVRDLSRHAFLTLLILHAHEWDFPRPPINIWWIVQSDHNFYLLLSLPLDSRWACGFLRVPHWGWLDTRLVWSCSLLGSCSS